MTEKPYRVFLKGDKDIILFYNEEEGDEIVSDCIEIDYLLPQIAKLTKPKLIAWLNGFKNKPKVE